MEFFSLASRYFIASLMFGLTVEFNWKRRLFDEKKLSQTPYPKMKCFSQPFGLVVAVKMSNIVDTTLYLV